MKHVNLKALVTSVALALGAGVAQAGPVIIDGTDAEEHGSLSGGVNINGWEYFQRGFENLLPQVGNGNKNVVCLGCTGRTETAFASAFDLAAKPAGWSRTTVDGVAGITAFFAGALGHTLANTGLIYIPTGEGNTSGGITGLELAVINANALALNNFVGGAGNPLVGGGLFAHGEGGTAGAWGWLTTLIPGIVPIEGGSNNPIGLTAAGVAAFPGLTDADIQGATPWHNYFSGSFGGLQVLVHTISGTPGRAVVIGGGAGSVIGCGQPNQLPCPPTGVPEPDTLLLIAISGLALMLTGARRRKAK